MIKQGEIQNTYDVNGLCKREPSSVRFIPESFIDILWRGRWFLLIPTVICLVIAFIYVSRATPIYTSTSKIYVEQSGPKIITELEEGVMTQSNNYLYTQAELLRSTPIISAALSVEGVRQMQTLREVDNPTAFLKRTLDISVGRRDDIIRISLDSPYPVEAAQLVNTIVDSYITFHATRKQSTSAEVLRILQNEKAIQGKELSDKRQALMDYREKNEELAFEGSQGNLVIEKLERLSTALTEAQLTTLELKSVYEYIKGMISNPAGIEEFIETRQSTGVTSSSNAERAELQSRLEDLELRRKNLLRQLTSGHPACIAYQNDIENLKAQIADIDTEFARAQLAVAEQQYLAAKEKENQISEYYDAQRQQAISLNEQLTQYTILQSDWEQTKELCDILDNRIKELNITEDVGALNISILEVANPAEIPSKPHKAKFMAIALFFGLLCGFGFALLQDYFDQKLHSVDEISNLLSLPVLGLVPKMPKKESVWERGRKIQLSPKSSWAEAYRTIRTAVFFGAPIGEIKTILITSPTPSDGKTTLVSNLAIAMAQAGQKILILDADFRKPMQNIIFGTNHENIGIINVLAGTSPIQKAIKSTDLKGLDILCRGPEAPNPSEILNSNGFAQILKSLSTKYDRILIDSPPVTPVTDAQILSANCDVTILVLRAEKTTRKISQQAHQSLLRIGARVLGVVVNDVSRKGSFGYYSGYGQYHEYYGDDRIVEKTLIAEKQQDSYQKQDMISSI